MFLGFFVMHYLVAHKPFLAIVHMQLAETQFSLLSYRWCECRVANVTHGRARRRHGSVKGGHHPHPGTTLRQGITRVGTVGTPEVPAPLVIRTGLQPGEVQKIMKNEYGNKDKDKDKDKDEASRKDKEGEAEKGKEKEKERGKDKPKEESLGITKGDLWTLQRVLDSRKSSLSSTHKRIPMRTIK